MARAWYEGSTDTYIIDFSADPAFPVIHSWDRDTIKWGMFTHGVCSAVVDNHMDFSRIAIFGRHLPDPAEKRLPELIEQAAFKLGRMAEEVQRQAPGSFHARQCLAASEALRRERDEIVRALLPSRQLHNLLQGHAEEQADWNSLTN